MLKIMTSAVPALILSLAAFSAGAAQLPASLMDKDNPGQEYWCKGDTSGNVQYVRRVHLDCDGDALLVSVDQVGPACHTGLRSCFDTAQVVVAGPTADAAGEDA